jgi:hypothetical protein
MKVIAIVDKAAGNDTVGTAWKETKIFDHDTPLIDVLMWAELNTNITITLPVDEHKEFIRLRSEFKK